MGLCSNVFYCKAPHLAPLGSVSLAYSSLRVHHMEDFSDMEEDDESVYSLSLYTRRKQTRSPLQASPDLGLAGSDENPTQSPQETALSFATRQERDRYALLWRTPSHLWPPWLLFG